MKPIISVLLIAFMFSFAGAKAQQTHFIYIQTGDKQPFYIKFDNKVYSSSTSGYLILSKLVDSTYNISIGFPKNEWGQQNFTCIINKKDNGYLLKNFGDKGWGLFNLQTLDVTMAGNPPPDKNIVKEERTDSFSNMLSAVVNDPSIKEKKVTKPEVKPDTVHPVQNTETAVVAEEPSKPTITTIDNVVKKSTIKRILKNKNADGTELVYLDNTDAGQDTIRIFIPGDKIAAPIQQEPVKQEEKAEEKKQEIIETPKPVVDTPAKIIEEKPVAKKDTTPTQTKAIEIVAVAPTENKNIIEPITNTACKNLASEEDFLKLRKKMAAEESDDNMINTAKKIFKTKCFTTAQVKNLSYLFLKDDGKYKFFDMAYPFVSDTQNFGTLQSQLTDAYYSDRFKAMIHH